MLQALVHRDFSSPQAHRLRFGRVSQVGCGLRRAAYRRAPDSISECAAKAGSGRRDWLAPAIARILWLAIRPALPETAARRDRPTLFAPRATRLRLARRA